MTKTNMAKLMIAGIASLYLPMAYKNNNSILYTNRALSIEQQKEKIAKAQAKRLRKDKKCN